MCSSVWELLFAIELFRVFFKQNLYLPNLALMFSMALFYSSLLVRRTGAQEFQN